MGDPTGKSHERSILSTHEIDTNVKSISRWMNDFFERARQHARIHLPDGEHLISKPRQVVLNNKDWQQNLTMLDFFQTVGRRLRMNTLLNRELYAV